MAKYQKPKTKKIKVNGNYPKDTSRGKKEHGMPATKKYIDVESVLKKNKEVKEKDVFDFSNKKSASPKK